MLKLLKFVSALSIAFISSPQFCVAQVDEADDEVILQASQAVCGTELIDQCASLATKDADFLKQLLILYQKSFAFDE